MAYLSKEAYEGKREYAARRMAENAEIDTLTEQQHEALARLCHIRHEIHSTDIFSLFNSESCEFTEMNNYFAELFDDGLLTSVGLPPLISIDWTTLPDNRDWTEFLSDEERQKYNAMAATAMEEYNKTGKKPIFDIYGYQMWLENGEEFEYFSTQIEKFNDDVEAYLRAIDKKHGTHYCPTGATRLF